MKTNTLVLFLFISTVSFAQIRLGVLAGGDVMTQRISGAGNSYFISTKSIFTYHGGFMCSIPINDEISLQPGLIYRIKGSKASGTDEYSIKNNKKVDYSGNYKYDYIELPINLAYTFPLHEVMELKITPYVGFYTAYAIRARSNVVFSDGDEKASNKAAGNWDFGVQVGTGVEFKDFFFRMEYSAGLVNIERGDKPTFHKSKTYNQGLSLSLGYWIHLTPDKPKKKIHHSNMKPHHKLKKE